MIEEKRRARINGNVNSKNHCKRVSLSQFIEKIMSRIPLIDCIGNPLMVADMT